MLTKKIREQGVINGYLVTAESEIDAQSVLAKARETAAYGVRAYLAEVSVTEPEYIDAKGVKTIALIDTGVKLSIIRNFQERSINVWRMPYSTKVDSIVEKKVDGLFFPNGPGDPKQAKDAIALVAALHEQLPIAGICLGNQIVGLGLGGKTYKLKFGHRGTNQPVQDLKTKKVVITSQNHGYAVDPASLGETGLQVTKVNLNDGSVEGLRHTTLPIITIQYHAEANPGPWDANGFFDEFVEMLK
jgi:carbamoyl-phosphate synthase small subunit